jgi:ubiquinone/menaquinone biosynthesis C-methylase UbiE
MAQGSREAWNEIASGYDRTNTPTQMWIASEGLRRAGLRAGASLLDVAAGSGALAIPAARLGAQVVAVDQSPAMLDLLRKRAGRENLAIETRVMDGHALELADASFDVAGSQFGVMLFPDMPKAIREMARVVKPGGRVVVHAYGDPHQIEFLGFFVNAIRSVRPEFDGPPSDPPPLEFQLSNPETLRTQLTAAGLHDVTVETVEEATEFRSAAELWDWIVSSNPIAESILGMLQVTRDERAAIERAIGTLHRDRAAGGLGATLTNPVHIGIGVK